MSKLVGILNDRKIYDDDPNLLKWQCDASYIPVWGVDYGSIGQTRCDHCGRANNGREDCKSCGAPLK